MVAANSTMSHNWTEMLASNDSSRQVAALEQLSRNPEQAALLAIELVGLAADRDDAVSPWVTEVLENLQSPPRQFIPDLIHRMNDREPDVVYWACRLIARIGEEAKPAEPKLVQLMDNHKSHVRQEAVRALGTMKGLSFETREKLRELAQTESDPRLARLAQQALEATS